MHSNELRQKFLKFFEERDHVLVPSSSLIPDDPSVLITTAGMQQFKPYYTASRDPLKDIHSTLGKPLGRKNAASIQKSFRTSDIESVGDTSHLTFFEMLGNFSFGGYFKKEAIEWAWEFIHHTLAIPLDRVSVSVFKGDREVPFDEESHRIWKELGMPDEKIFLQGREENFWGPTGDEGPCGPTSEVYVDGVEVWNLVFNEYYCGKDKSLTPLEMKGVDTGMGLERLSLVVQFPADPEKTIFDTDLFKPIMDAIPAKDAQFLRIIADHLRAAIFLIADGVQPSNLERGYILRRLLRRAARYANLLGLGGAWYEPILQAVVKTYGETYPELLKVEEIRMTIANEYEKFEKALEKGLKEFERLTKDRVISGKDVFHLYQSYGFPFEMIEELAKEKGIAVEKRAFEEEFQKHQEISKRGQEKKFGGHGLVGYGNEITEKYTAEERAKMTRLHTATHLLHQALRDVLGSSVRQMGSDITPSRTRFDFSYNGKVSQEELNKVEDIVNQKIKEDLPVKKEAMPYEEAIASGALAFFKEKYPARVDVYSIGDYSKELCGGPHVSKTSEIGRFRILKEEAVAAGVRRIRATVEP